MTAATPHEVLLRAESAGLHLSAEADKLIVEAEVPDSLTDEWRERLRQNKPQLLALLSHPETPPLSPADLEDIQEAQAERAAVMEYDGHQDRDEAERAARAAMRVYRYRLTTGRGWCTLIAPGWSLDDAENDLLGRYGERLLKVIEHRPTTARGTSR